MTAKDLQKHLKQRGYNNTTGQFAISVFTYDILKKTPTSFLNKNKITITTIEEGIVHGYITRSS